MIEFVGGFALGVLVCLVTKWLRQGYRMRRDIEAAEGMRGSGVGSDVF